MCEERLSQEFIPSGGGVVRNIVATPDGRLISRVAA